MTTKNEQKRAKNVFHCICCNFTSYKKNNFERHIMTSKHQRLQNTTIKEQKEQPDDKKFSCECGKSYKHHSSLYNHKHKCNYKSNIDSNANSIENNDVNKKLDDTMNYKNLFFELINENKEMRSMLMNQQKQITEIIPKIGNNNVINNTTNNKNKFNINVFLNEKCKDAISLDEFINKIEISMSDLITTKDKGMITGISNIIIENMSKLSLYERPLHCTDKKRETLYVKNNEWEKDENKEQINKALKQIESKQLKNVKVWLDEHPNYMNCSKQQEEFAELLRECGKSIEDNKEKIIKNICNEVYVDKD
jgi:hypothetical protein